jgi:hypothetical protein
MLSWEAAVELGRAIEQLRQHDTRIGRAEATLSEVREEIGTLRQWLMRGTLLVLLWTGAVASHLSAETAGEIIAMTIKSLRR